MTERRLIEETFPLKEVSEHSKHEKNVRHGHISTLHIWPARRPLAACRAAIIAALLDDPGNEEDRRDLNKRIASITKWGTENGSNLDFFRQKIREKYGRAPRVLDMFAGGGAIPLEAMRLGCKVTAIDYNPVAWFILKCTLEFPQRLAGKTWPLPEDAPKKLKQISFLPDDAPEDVKDKIDTEQMNGEATTSSIPGSYAQSTLLTASHDNDMVLQGDLVDHVRYWGNWVLEHARNELKEYYPTINSQPTVAYLWARTVPCPDPACGTTVPLLKTLWLCKKAEKTLPDTPENRSRPDFLRIKKTKKTSHVIINARRALRLLSPKRGEGGLVHFEIFIPGPDEKVPNGTMSEAKTQCPCCGINITSDYIKRCGNTGKLEIQMTAVVVETGHFKDYRLPSIEEQDAVQLTANKFCLDDESIPFGLIVEPLPGKERHRAVGSQLPDYGFQSWADIFTPRQLLASSAFIRSMQIANECMLSQGYKQEWIEAVESYLAVVLDKTVDYNTSLCMWHNSGEYIAHTYTRYALAMTWDFVELAVINDVGGGYSAQLEWVLRYIEHSLNAVTLAAEPQILCRSAVEKIDFPVDVIITDPPYYDAIPYADLSDLFYLWLRRTIGNRYPDNFGNILSPKVEELVQHNKTGEQGINGKANYESGMATAFQRANEILSIAGYLVVVFANKQPDAWETLVTALIKANFVVSASWPVDTEMQSGVRSKVASLASSVWLVCRKRSDTAGIGRYKNVRKAMEERITERLRYFWDMGLSGPDFVWAAVGPALEAYSAYQDVRRLDGSLFTVSDFLKEVRRLVADFALGQILKGHSTETLDDWTRYYLIHRSNFGLEETPVGEGILLAQGYGLNLNTLRTARGLIVNGSGSSVILSAWDERIRNDLGEPHPNGELPILDMLHRVMQLWAAGNLDALNTYAAEKGLRQNELFWTVAQAILEMATLQSRERSLLEAIVAWGAGNHSTTKVPPISQNKQVFY